ncbi:DNA internalization-related competence protein ComEC/Rec2 [Bacillus niameyensis]|uniref:DNA internalization-related competence protein ComEC/Rec2 n=1 Tax=Bacillus niameyensis TaxID=1522308 RepID=UPI000781EF4F|nr:DNA internalization-related competence protein ComEC/Rec2 [Bacillus niameyensis]
MLRGRWVFLALAALSGVLFVLEFHYLSLLFSTIIFFRILLEKQSKLMIIFCFMFVSFVLSAFVSERNHHTIYDEGKVQLSITFDDVPQIDGNQLRAVVSSKQEKFLLTHKILSEAKKYQFETRIRSGTACTLSGELVQPSRSRNENAFDYAMYLNKQNIHWMLKVSEFTVEDCKQTTSFLSVLRNGRNNGIKSVEENFPSKLIPYANALIFGDRSAFSDDTFESYQRLGVVHLLAISGLHVGLISGFFYFLFIRIGFTKETVYWILVFFLPLYAVISGGNPPVIRAIIMTLLLLSSQRWRFPLTTLDTLSLSFIVFLLFDPYVVYNVGFQLSFTVTFALIITSKKTLKGSVFIKLLNVSLTSMFASLPILTYHFYEFSILSILANIIFVPFYTIIVLPAMLFLWSIQTIPYLFSLFAEPITEIIAFSEWAATFVSSWKYAVIVTGKPNMLSLFLMILGVLAYFLITEHKKKQIVAFLPLTMILVGHLLFVQYSPTGEVVFIDVGQGDSILIKLPYNRGTYLIDTGGTVNFTEEEWQRRKKPYKVGKAILLPLLKSKGIHKLDKLILTHADIDHIGAGEDLIENISIEEIYISPNSWVKPVMKDIVISARKKGIHIKEGRAGISWNNLSGDFYFIYPFDENYEGNNDSLVLLANFGGLNWLFMGDIEKEGEWELIRSYKQLKADVLKIGHHGSRTSTTEDFLKKVNPQYAIISAGENNRFGHPHEEVVELLEDYNVHIFRTDQQGAVHYVFSNRIGTFKTVLQ